MEIRSQIRYPKRSARDFDSVLLLSCFACSLFGVIFSYTNTELVKFLSYFKYMVLLVLYFKYAERSVSFFVPLLFFLFFFILVVVSPYSYSSSRLFVVGTIPIWLYILRKTFLKERFKRTTLAILIFYILYVMFILDKSQVNSNQIAFCYLLCFVTIYSFRTLHFITFQLFLVLSFLCIGGIVLSGSRTSFLVFFIILVLSHYLQKYKKPALFFFVLCLMGIIVPIVYTALADLYKVSHTEFMNQDVFSGREYVWNMIFSEFRNIDHLLYGGVVLSSWDKSYHNSFFDIWVDLGIICLTVYVLICFYFFWLYESLISPKVYKVLYIISLSMIWGYFESGWFLGHAIPLLFPLLFVSKNSSPIVKI